MEHRIYMGSYISTIIENELKNEEYDWYKESRIRQEDGSYIEINYFLSNEYLLRTEVSGDKCKIQKFDKGKIVKVEQEYGFRQEFGIQVALEKILIYFESEVLELKRPTYKEDGDTKGFEKLAQLL